MNDDRGFSNAGILVSFVAGGLTGAALALLLAPRSGQGTRGLINQRIREGVDRGREVKERVASKGREVLEEASSYVGKQRKNLEQHYERLVSPETGRPSAAKPTP